MSARAWTVGASRDKSFRDGEASVLPVDSSVLGEPVPLLWLGHSDLFFALSSGPSEATPEGRGWCKGASLVLCFSIDSKTMNRCLLIVRCHLTLTVTVSLDSDCTPRSAREGEGPTLAPWDYW